jgi:hypothetical protein
MWQEDKKHFLEVLFLIGKNEQNPLTDYYSYFNIIIIDNNNKTKGDSL